jgi:tetratricopeptide (TPR) repeat protein
MDLDSDPPWMVMDLVEGQSLEILIKKRGPFPAREAVSLVIQIARSVQFLHEHEVIHRDLKPGNIVLDAQGKAVLIDFGLAASGGLSTMTRSGDLLGTPAYMAPELARGEKATCRTDVFGLGGLLFALLCGRPPHLGEAFAIIERVGRKPPPSLPPGISVSKELRAILSRAMAFSPKWRFGSAAELRQALVEFEAGLRVQGLSQPWGRRVEEEWKFHKGRVLGIGFVFGLGVALGPLLSRLEQARKRDSQQALLQGTRAFLNGDSEEAKKLGFVVLRSEPKNRTALFLVGKDPKGLLARVQFLLKSNKAGQGIPLAQKAIVELPGDPLPVALLGLCALRGDRNALAEKELISAHRMLPGTPLILHSLAVAKRRLGDEKRALSLLNQALDLDPDRIESLFERSKLWGRQKKPEKGLRDIEKAIRLAGPKKVPKFLNVRASYLDEAGRKKEAEKVFREILESFPNRPSVLFNLAFTLDGLDRLKEAAEVYHLVLRKGWRDPKVLLSLSWLHSGSRKETCDLCAKQFKDHPELLDFSAAKRFLLEGVERNEGRSESILRTALLVARRIGEERELGKLLDLISRKKDISDRRLGRVVRFLRFLDIR